MKLCIDKYVLPSIDSDLTVPTGDYELFGIICIEGKKITKFNYYSLVCKMLKHSKQKRWFRYYPDDYIVEEMNELTPNHYPQMLFYNKIDKQFNDEMQ